MSGNIPKNRRDAFQELEDYIAEKYDSYGSHHYAFLYGLPILAQRLS